MPITFLSNLDFTNQIIALNQLVSTSSLPISALVAFTLLTTKFPVQVPLTSAQIIALSRFAFNREIFTQQSLLPPNYAITNLCRGSELEKYFPFKRDPAAKMKTNFKLKEVISGLKNMRLLHRYEPMLRALAGRSSDDQAVGAVLYATGLAATLGPYAYEFATCSILCPKDAKGFSTALKALGANSDVVGARMVEADTLLGRGVGLLDLSEEARYRCDPTKIANSVIDVDQSQLAQAIDDILDEELADQSVNFEELGDFWHSRWLWCVNGAHSRVLDRQGGLNTKTIFPGVDRVYRRMYAEAATAEPISTWDGTVLVSTSEKLEHGKRRALFACDTRSYFAFEHLLKPIEKRWHGRRVILDPGLMGHLGVVLKIKQLRAGGGVNVMLDYDDFNSQHSTESMQTVFARVCARTNYPPELTANIISSFSKEQIYHKGEKVGTCAGTLMSGHRGTTFINSILNAAYIRCAVGRQEYESLKCMHVGDDIYSSATTHSAAASLLDKCASFGCRMNPVKQSVGTVGAEFLRMGVRDTHASGYLARSIASAVSGNWVNESKLSPQEGLRSILGSVHTLKNRSGCPLFAELLTPAVCKITRLKKSVVYSLLSGAKAIEGSPQFRSDGYIRTYAEVPPPPDNGTEIPAFWPKHATEDYIVHRASAVEQFAFQAIQRSPVSVMLIASYSKALADATREPPGVRLKSNKPRVPVGSVSARQLLKTEKQEGILSPYPILNLIKGHLNHSLLRELVGLCGGDPAARDIEDVAWGVARRTSLITGALSYADAASLSGRTTAGVVYTTYPVYM